MSSFWSLKLNLEFNRTLPGKTAQGVLGKGKANQNTNSWLRIAVVLHKNTVFVAKTFKEFDKLEEEKKALTYPHSTLS